MALRQHKFFRPATAAMVTIACGLLLLCTLMGEAWVNASYDYLFRFVARNSTLPVVLIEMDNESYEFFHQKRGQRWDRALHAQLLERLAQDGCRLVVFDCWFHEPMDPAKDKALADAMRRARAVVLMAEADGAFLKNAISPDADLESVRPYLPAEIFRNAASNHWGVPGQHQDPVVRRHWPFPASGADNLLSLPWVAATLLGAKLTTEPQEQWLRYYSKDGAWDAMSYRLWTNQVPGYFRNKIVFIGDKPESPAPEQVKDKFSVPYTRWTAQAVGGVEVLATEFLNLVNGDWLRRPAGWVEVTMVVLVGALLGAGLCHFRPLRATGVAMGAAALVALGAMYLTHKTNYWFPWLVIAGGQVPCALACALAGNGALVRVSQLPGRSTNSQALEGSLADAEVPHAADYEVFTPAFGEGSYGKVWLARNAIGQWQALKAVYRCKFGSNAKPYDREFNGIRRYKPVSDKHPGLLRVDFVSKKKSPGYFYYVMELGDSLEEGWQQDPSRYRPRDLAKVLAQAEQRRLPTKECLSIAAVLAEAIDFLHSQSLTHGDIKPQNIIFVEGQPKLADVGLVNDLPDACQSRTGVGTPGYMPPGELVGTPQADIYALGMVLYVMFMGQEPCLFPAVATTLLEGVSRYDFLSVNSIILRACHPDGSRRYTSAGAMAEALRETLGALQGQLA